MATTLRPVGHEDKLTLVDHLDELRSRLVICVITLVISFGICFWQNNAILDIVTEPVQKAQKLDEDDVNSKDPLEQSARFQRELKTALGVTAAAQEKLGQSLASLATDGDLAAARQRSLSAAVIALTRSTTELRQAANAAPANPERNLVTLGVTEPFTSTITIALYAALLLAMPMLLYQLYAFVLPAFSPGEKKIAFPIMLMVPVLFIGGVCFGYFVVLQRALEFLQNFNDDSFDILLQAKEYFRFVVLFVAGIGFLFQIPVFVLAVTRSGILTPKQLASNRGYVILGIAILAAVVTPTPDPITMTLAMGPLIVLFEISILGARWLERIAPVRVFEEVDEDADGGPDLDDEPDPDPDDPEKD